MTTIVKIQIPLASNEPDPPALVYNEDRSIEQTFPLNRAIVDMLTDSNGKTKPKAYFEAYLDEDGRLVIGHEVGEQNW